MIPCVMFGRIDKDMLTVQEIQTPEFEKAVFGGYDQKAVDDFMETVAADFASLQKENAALKSKMKVLVDKIEEYRSVETVCAAPWYLRKALRRKPLIRHRQNQRS